MLLHFTAKKGSAAIQKLYTTAHITFTRRAQLRTDRSLVSILIQSVIHIYTFFQYSCMPDNANSASRYELLVQPLISTISIGSLAQIHLPTNHRPRSIMRCASYVHSIVCKGARNDIVYFLALLSSTTKLLSQFRHTSHNRDTAFPSKWFFQSSTSGDDLVVLALQQRSSLYTVGD